MNLSPRNLEASSLSRIMGHIKGERNFGVVSAFRGGLGKKENFVNYYNPSDMISYISQITSHFRLLHNYKSLPQREMLLILEKK